jgi:hypothetical protein
LISHGIYVCKYKLDRRKTKALMDGCYKAESLAFRMTVWRNDKRKGMATGILCPLLFLILRIQVVPGQRAAAVAT